MAESGTSGTDHRRQEQHRRLDAQRTRHSLRLLLQLQWQTMQPERAAQAELSRDLDAERKRTWLQLWWQATREGSTSGAQQRARRGTEKNLAGSRHAGPEQHKGAVAGQNFVSAQLEHCTCGDCTNILHAKSSKLTLTFTNAEKISKLQAIKEEFLQRHKFENARHGSRSSYEVGFAEGARLSAVNFFINGFSISSVKQISSSNKVANESFKNHNTSTAA